MSHSLLLVSALLLRSHKLCAARGAQCLVPASGRVDHFFVRGPSVLTLPIWASAADLDWRKC